MVDILGRFTNVITAMGAAIVYLIILGAMARIIYLIPIMPS